MNNFEYFGGRQPAAWTLKIISERMGLRYETVERPSWEDEHKRGMTIIDEVFDGDKKIMNLRSCYVEIPNSKELPLTGTSVYFSNDAKELLRRAKISMKMQERQRKNN